jgi:hypothetical protein
VGQIMLGYEMSDVDDMINAIQSIITTVNSDDDPWLHNNLWKAQEFLQGLWAEGYFDGYQD